MKEMKPVIKNCMIITHNLPNVMKSLLKEKNNNRAKTIRDSIKRFMGNGGKIMLKELQKNTKLDITTFNCCGIIKEYLTLLTKMRIFPSRSEAIRFIVMYDLLTNNEAEEIEEEHYEPIVIRRLDTNNLIQNKKPNRLLTLESGEFYINLVVSFMNEQGWLNTTDLGNLLGVNQTSIPPILNKINKRYPTLLLKKKQSKHSKKRAIYNVDKEVLNELLEKRGVK